MSSGIASGFSNTWTENKEVSEVGAWGAKLYQDDTALDIKNRFDEDLRKGKTVEEITKEFIEEYAFKHYEYDLVFFVVS